MPQPTWYTNYKVYPVFSSGGAQGIKTSTWPKPSIYPSHLALGTSHSRPLSAQDWLALYLDSFSPFLYCSSGQGPGAGMNDQNKSISNIHHSEKLKARASACLSFCSHSKKIKIKKTFHLPTFHVEHERCSTQEAVSPTLGCSDHLRKLAEKILPCGSKTSKQTTLERHYPSKQSSAGRCVRRAYREGNGAHNRVRPKTVFSF